MVLSPKVLAHYKNHLSTSEWRASPAFGVTLTAIVAIEIALQLRTYRDSAACPSLGVCVWSLIRAHPSDSAGLCAAARGPQDASHPPRRPPCRVRTLPFTFGSRPSRAAPRLRAVPHICAESDIERAMRREPPAAVHHAAWQRGRGWSVASGNARIDFMLFPTQLCRIRLPAQRRRICL